MLTRVLSGWLFAKAYQPVVRIGVKDAIVDGVYPPRRSDGEEGSRLRVGFKHAVESQVGEDVAVEQQEGIGQVLDQAQGRDRY